MKNNQKGFAHIGLIILAILVLGVVGFAGYWVMNKNKDKTASDGSNTASQSQSDMEKAQPKQTSSNVSLKLANDKVQFEIPKDWTIGKSKCVDSPGAAPACIDGATLVPGEKMPTIYGNGTEFFTVYTQVYDNKDNKSAKQWFEGVYGGSMSSGSDKASSDKINGYDTYYYRQLDTSYDEISYVYTASGKAVLVSARVSEKHFVSDGSGKVDASSDFTKYVPEIEKMAKTIKFN